MTKHSPIHRSSAATATTTVTAPRRDYLPAAGRDALLPFYDRLTALLGVPALHRTLIEQADLADGQRVLEIGCGTGNLSVLVRHTHPGVEVTGSDPDPLALGRAQRKAETRLDARGLAGIRFDRGYAQELPYPDSSFDRVLSSLMLHHLDRATKLAAAAEILRVLRPGGSLHVVDFAGPQHGLHGRLASRMVKSGHASDNADGGLARLLTEADLSCETLATRTHPLMGDITFYRATRA